MNKDNAHLYLHLIQALMDGKTIQVNVGNSYGEEWVDKDELQFDLPNKRYRIKPEPITQEFYYIVEKETGKSIYGGGITYNHPTLTEAKNYLEKMGSNADKHTIMCAKAVEVLSE